MPQDFISDAQMATLEQSGAVQTPQNNTPDFIPDTQADLFFGQEPKAPHPFYSPFKYSDAINAGFAKSADSWLVNPLGKVTSKVTEPVVGAFGNALAHAWLGTGWVKNGLNAWTPDLNAAFDKLNRKIYGHGLPTYTKDTLPDEFKDLATMTPEESAIKKTTELGKEAGREGAKIWGLFQEFRSGVNAVFVPSVAAKIQIGVGAALTYGMGGSAVEDGIEGVKLIMEGKRDGRGDKIDQGAELITNAVGNAIFAAMGVKEAKEGRAKLAEVGPRAKGSPIINPEFSAQVRSEIETFKAAIQGKDIADVANQKAIDAVGILKDIIRPSPSEIQKAKGVRFGEEVNYDSDLAVLGEEMRKSERQDWLAPDSSNTKIDTEVGQKEISRTIGEESAKANQMQEKYPYKVEPIDDTNLQEGLKNKAINSAQADEKFIRAEDMEQLRNRISEKFEAIRREYGDRLSAQDMGDQATAHQRTIPFDQKAKLPPMDELANYYVAKALRERLYDILPDEALRAQNRRIAQLLRARRILEKANGRSINRQQAHWLGFRIAASLSGVLAKPIPGAPIALDWLARKYAEGVTNPEYRAKKAMKKLNQAKRLENLPPSITEKTKNWNFGGNVKDVTKSITPEERKTMREFLAAEVAGTSDLNLEMDARHIFEKMGGDKTAPTEDIKATFKSVLAQPVKPQRGVENVDPNYTSKFLEKMTDKPYHSKNELLQLIRGPEFSVAEKEAVVSVLEKMPAKFETKEFIKALDEQMLKTTPESGDKWANYGLDNLENAGMLPTQDADMRIFDTKVQHGVSGHTGKGTELGWTRTFKVDRPEFKDAEFVSEMQSDPFQRGFDLREGAQKKSVARWAEWYDKAVKETEDGITTYEKDKADHGQNTTPEDRAYQDGKFQSFWLERGKLYKEVLDAIKAREAKGEQMVPDSVMPDLDGLRDVIYRIADAKTDIFKAEHELKQTHSADIRNQYDADLADAKERLVRYQKHYDMQLKEVKEAPINPAQIEKLSPQEQQFENLKSGNRYRNRLLEEYLVDAKNRGVKEVYIPKPSTVAQIEWNKIGGDNQPPYEFNGGRDTELSPGDTITYGGENMTVVQADRTEITVVPSGKVNSFDRDLAISEEADFRWDEIAGELERNDLFKGKGLSPTRAAKFLDNPAKNSLDWWTEKMLEEVAKGDKTYKNVDELHDDHFDNVASEVTDGFDDYLDDVYGEWWQDGDTIYTAESRGSSETFSQPSEYDDTVDISELQQIDSSRKALDQSDFSNTEKGVLDNYYQYREHLEKLKKRFGIDVEDVQVEGLNWTKVKLNDKIKIQAFAVAPFALGSMSQAIGEALKGKKKEEPKKEEKPKEQEFTATHYNPVDPRQTKKKADGKGALMRPVGFGDVAVGNRDILKKAKELKADGKDLLIKISELSDVKTPYGKGVFRVNDTMNIRFDGQNKIDIALPPDAPNRKELQKRIGKSQMHYSFLAKK